MKRSGGSFPTVSINMRYMRIYIDLDSFMPAAELKVGAVAGQDCSYGAGCDREDKKEIEPEETVPKLNNYS